MKVGKIRWKMCSSTLYKGFHNAIDSQSIVTFEFSTRLLHYPILILHPGTERKTNCWRLGYPAEKYGNRRPSAGGIGLWRSVGVGPAGDHWAACNYGTDSHVWASRAEFHMHLDDTCATKCLKL